MKIVLGTVQFGLNYGINNKIGKPTQDEVFEILLLAYDSGIRHLDTAEAYGNAHALIGEFHKKFPSKKFKITTKFPNQKLDNIRQKMNEYLISMEVDSLETLLFHSFGAYQLNKEVLIQLNSFKNSTNKIKNLGVSIYTNEELEKVIEDENIDVIQLPFNLLDNIKKRGELLEKAKAKNKVVQTRSVFLQGLFCMEPSSGNKIQLAFSSELESLNEIVKNNGISMAELALNYCYQQKDIDFILIGVDNKDQLINNLISLTKSIDKDIIEQINQIDVVNEQFLNPSTWN